MKQRKNKSYCEMRVEKKLDHIFLDGLVSFAMSCRRLVRISLF